MEPDGDELRNCPLSRQNDDFTAPEAGDPRDDDIYVELARLPTSDADALCVRLEAAGLPCDIEFIPWANRSDPDAVKVVVRDEDLTAARQVMAEPNAPLETEEHAIREDYLVSNWICPRCRGRLDLLPLARGWRRVWQAWIAVVVLACLVSLVGEALSVQFLKVLLDDVPAWAVAVWLGLLVLLLPVLRIARKHICPDCGWVEGQPPAESSGPGGGQVRPPCG